MHIRWII